MDVILGKFCCCVRGIKRLNMLLLENNPFCGGNSHSALCHAPLHNAVIDYFHIKA